jgi:hypothetical protein
VISVQPVAPLELVELDELVELELVELDELVELELVELDELELDELDELVELELDELVELELVELELELDELVELELELVELDELAGPDELVESGTPPPAPAPLKDSPCAHAAMAKAAPPRARSIWTERPEELLFFMVRLPEYRRRRDIRPRQALAATRGPLTSRDPAGARHYGAATPSHIVGLALPCTWPHRLAPVYAVFSLMQ